jgi:transcriptional regulator with XRE-family HTH domain
MITRFQITAGRALLEWTQDDLATASGVSKDMISKIEGGKSAGSLKSLQSIEDAFTLSGIEFGQNDGVRRAGLRTKTYRGQSGFIEFMNFVYETARDQGGAFCVSNID